MKTQGRFLWQNWPPGWVVSRSGVTSVGGGYFYICPNLVSEFFGQNFFLATWKFWRGVGVLLHLSKFGVGIFWPAKNFGGGTFTFVQIWCQNFLAKIFFWPVKNFGGGYLYICPNLVSEFFGWNFFWPAENFWGGYFYISPKMTSEFFPNCGGYQNMKTLECHETSRYAKIFDLGAFFVDHFGPQSSGWAKFGCHFDPVTPIAQGPDFYWSFIFCPSLPVPNLVLISWMM